MTLFIACLLIYHFDMTWWWYAIAAAIWAGHLFMQPTIPATISGFFNN